MCPLHFIVLNVQLSVTAFSVPHAAKRLSLSVYITLFIYVCLCLQCYHYNLLIKQCQCNYFCFFPPFCFALVLTRILHYLYFPLLSSLAYKCNIKILLIIVTILKPKIHYTYYYSITTLHEVTTLAVVRSTHSQFLLYSEAAFCSVFIPTGTYGHWFSNQIMYINIFSLPSNTLAIFREHCRMYESQADLFVAEVNAELHYLFAWILLVWGWTPYNTAENLFQILLLSYSS